MNDGVIEQIGTPTEIYREPASLFVADFIGSMNKLQVTVADESHVKIGTATLACRSHGLAKKADAVLALRPEDVTPLESAGAAKAVNAYPVKVRDMEFLGSHWRASLTSEAFGGAEIDCQFSINAVRRLDISQGADLSIQLPQDRAHVFTTEGRRG
jgi:iron(III) transport system ATP-binding protein